MFRLVFAMTCVAALAACEEQKPVEQMGYAEMQTLAKQISDRCTALGLDPASAQHQQCRQIEAQKEITTRRANTVRRNNAYSAMGAGMQQMSDNYNRQAQAYQNRSLNCTTQSFGNSVHTNCY